MGSRVLIVDDSSGFRRTAKALLEREGMTVVGVASNSAEAIRLAATHEPDVTLIDIHLGGESGLDLARVLGEATHLRGPQTILISTHAELDFADLIELSPAIGFLAKEELSARTINGVLARDLAGDSFSKR